MNKDDCEANREERGMKENDDESMINDK